MAVYDLRLKPKQFYRLTPRQFSLLVKQHSYATQHTELLHGLTTSTIVNFSMAAPKKPVNAQDYMPSMFGKAEIKRVRKMTDKQVAAECRALFSGLAKASQAK